jgi:regulator of protease activity HflC (stomatin/prohibitin superfamily)
MKKYGFSIIKALVTDIDPDPAVKASMNRINAAEREKTAAEFEGESERIKIVAKAKAEAESKRLQGEGIANQRRAIAAGIKDSVEELNKVGIPSTEASALIMLPNGPSGATDMLAQMTASFTAAQAAGKQSKVLAKKSKDTPS